LLHHLTGLRPVGSPVSRIESVLGKPTSVKNGTYIYEGETEVIQFLQKGGMISKIIIGYYTG